MGAIMRSVWIVLMCIASIAPTRLDAQAVLGDRLRVEHTDGLVVTGTLVRMTPGALQLKDDRAVLVVPQSQIRALERSLGGGGSFARNFAFAVGAGALLGGAYAALSFDRPAGEDCMFCPYSRDGAFDVGALVGAIVAVPIGVIAGIGSRTERWRTIALAPTVGLGAWPVADARGGVGLYVRLPVGGFE
jgi:hypothetical protein